MSAKKPIQSKLMKHLISLALAMTALTTPVTAKEASTWDLAIATVGAFQCSAAEGLMTVEDSVKAAYDFLKTRRDLEPYQVMNIMKTKGFWPAVRAFQERHGGCPSIAKSIKSKAQQRSVPSDIY